jgi:hypothetical protein
MRSESFKILIKHHLIFERLFLLPSVIGPFSQYNHKHLYIISTSALPDLLKYRNSLSHLFSQNPVH